MDTNLKATIIQSFIERAIQKHFMVFVSGDKIKVHVLSNSDVTIVYPRRRDLKKEIELPSPLYDFDTQYDVWYDFAEKHINELFEDILKPNLTTNPPRE